MPNKTARRRREEFDIRLTDTDLIRVTFDRQNDHVVQFSVQYLAFVQHAWQPIVRFDTAHGQAHMDISHPDGRQDTRELPAQDYNDALTHAIQDVETRWEFYRERYGEELE